MWIMLLVLVHLTTGEEKTVYAHTFQYPTEAECMASYTHEPVLWDGYEMKTKCVQLGMDE